MFCKSLYGLSSLSLWPIFWQRVNCYGLLTSLFIISEKVISHDLSKLSVPIKLRSIRLNVFYLRMSLESVTEPSERKFCKLRRYKIFVSRFCYGTGFFFCTVPFFKTGLQQLYYIVPFRTQRYKTGNVSEFQDTPGANPTKLKLCFY